MRHRAHRLAASLRRTDLHVPGAGISSRCCSSSVSSRRRRLHPRSCNCHRAALRKHCSRWQDRPGCTFNLHHHHHHHHHHLRALCHRLRVLCSNCPSSSRQRSAISKSCRRCQLRPRSPTTVQWQRAPLRERGGRARLRLIRP